jgi:hypothetical protein
MCSITDPTSYTRKSKDNVIHSTSGLYHYKWLNTEVHNRHNKYSVIPYVRKILSNLKAIHQRQQVLWIRYFSLFKFKINFLNCRSLSYIQQTLLMGDCLSQGHYLHRTTQKGIQINNPCSTGQSCRLCKHCNEHSHSYDSEHSYMIKGIISLWVHWTHALG